MSGIVVVAETRRGEVRDVSLELINAGRQMKDRAGGRLVVAVIAADPTRYVDALRLDGVDEIVLVRSPAEHFEPDLMVHGVRAIIELERPTLVLTGFTVDAMGFAPALAAEARLGFASDVTAITWDDAGPIAQRGAYGGKLIAEIVFPAKSTILLMVRGSVFEPAGGVGSAQVRELDVDLGQARRTEHVGFREAETGDVDITTAEFLLSVGRGIEDRDALERFDELARRLNATLSVSRPLVDAGWISSSRQVGQSGRTVKPKIYLALGISGAVQHLAGMRNAQTIIAVNTDADAPIFEVAHYGAVADLFDVADSLEQQFE